MATTLTTPDPSGTYGGTSITITATSTPPPFNTISNIKFYVDGVNFATATSSPYTGVWDTTASLNGSHEIKAITTYSGGSTDQATETVFSNNSVVGHVIVDSVTGNVKAVNAPSTSLQVNGAVTTTGATTVQLPPRMSEGQKIGVGIDFVIALIIMYAGYKMYIPKGRR